MEAHKRKIREINHKLAEQMKKKNDNEYIETQITEEPIDTSLPRPSKLQQANFFVSPRQIMSSMHRKTYFNAAHSIMDDN